MRTEKEMMELILRTAEEDSRIRAVYMNGSRTNPNAPKDIFQDYDIVYVVEETGSFIRDKEWIRRFGDILFMQYPDEDPDYPSDKENSYGWLMIFTDGNRLDLTVKSVPHAKENVKEDSLCKILLDKDGILPEIPEASEETYVVQRPSKEQFAAVCNEFWWCLNNIAKGLWRKEVTYAQDMLNFVVRKQLEKMLSWKIGELTDYSVSVGKSGKYMKKWLSEEEWQKYLDTYCDADINNMWKSVETMCRLFYDTSRWVAEQNGFLFDRQEADNSFGYFTAVKETDANATSIIR
ncbi:MAG: aminoglycoside 6-adenylyltransferase [Lachnospiraceae bacterium]|nr:aminoglycoside 6-adenylyltransferase [Lachnospiraceae bacterium]